MRSQVDICAEVLDQIRQILNEEAIGISPETSLIAEGLLDSLAILDLIEFIEQRFQLSLEEGEMTPENFETVSRISLLIREKLEASAEVSR